MRNYKRQMVFILVIALVISSLAACLPQPARRPVPNDTNNYRTNTNTDIPYTAQNNQNMNGNNTKG
ncbi:MAG: hypothetical protein K0Q99_580, partial [Clostridia bacterium]|nr:hypothetical protein [Clostridia bacterium]